jgi:hypothetical protein
MDLLIMRTSIHSLRFQPRGTAAHYRMYRMSYRPIASAVTIPKAGQILLLVSVCIRQVLNGTLFSISRTPDSCQITQLLAGTYGYAIMISQRIDPLPLTEHRPLTDLLYPHCYPISYPNQSSSS